jgi:aryl-alcohol dehydrogenase-like predicted oxidoreductase
MISKKNISLLGFGTWGLGSDSYGNISEKKSLTLLNHSIKNGINFIDTSNIYGRGLSEKRIGLLLLKNEHLRRKIFIATKCGMKNHSTSSWFVPQDFNINFLRNSINESLKRLNTNYIDLIQLHSPPLRVLKNKIKINKILNLFKRLKKKGVIRYFGVSVKSPQDAQYILKNYKSFNFIQLNFNLIDQRALDCGALDLAYKKKVSIIARTPFAFGYLAGNVKLKKNDHRKKWSKKQTYLWSKGRLDFVKLTGRNKITSANLALLFATSHPAIKTVIPGMLELSHINESIKFLNLKKLSTIEIQKIRCFYQSKIWMLKAKN